MTENEAIERLKMRIRTASEIAGNGIDGKAYEDMEIAIKALDEIQKYRKIGTVEDILDAVGEINKKRPTDKLRKQFSNSQPIHVGEVVYTKSSRCVLDIGLVESLNPLTILAPYSKYMCEKIGYKRYYGNPSISHWHGTNIYKSLSEWECISKGIYAREICFKLGVPYSVC